MSQKLKVSWCEVVLTLVTVSLFLLSGAAEAKNPDISYWTLNLSESAAPDELGEYDLAPEIEVVGSTVHVMWLTRNIDWSGYRVYYRRSIDNGQTWEPKQLLFTNDDLIINDTYKRMAVTGDTVHIAVNYYEGSWYGVLGYLRSTNNGASFEPIRPLYNASGAHHVFDVRVAASNGKVTIGYEVERNWEVNDGYYLLTSDDGGTEFTPRTVYTTATYRRYVDDLQRVGDNIYVLFRQDGWVYLSASAAGGGFIENQMSVPASPKVAYPLQNSHYVPKIAGVGNQVSVIWNGQDSEGVHSVFTCQSTNSGASFGEAINLTRDVIPEDKALQAGQETLAAQGSYVYSLFVTTASNVYLRRSTDGGVNFLGLQELNSATAPYINDGWWPVIRTDPSVASGAKVHVFWDLPKYCFSADGGASFTKLELVTPYFSYGGTVTSGANYPYMAIGPDGKVHFTMQARYYSDSFGGYGDFDIFYRGLAVAAAPSGANNGLHLFSNTNDARRDNMQVRASSDLNFTSQMTGEVWVRPYAGGTTTGTTSGIEPIFHKLEAGYKFAYALETWGTYDGGQRRAAVEINTTEGNCWLNSSTPVPDNVWSHLAFTYDASGGDNNLKLYMNGQLIASATAAGNLISGDGLFFTGFYGIWDVAELRLWNVVRTQAQIAANMRRSLAGNEPGLNAYYTFKNTTQDLTGHGNDGILMYMEQYIQQSLLTAGAGPAVDFLLLLD